MHGILTPSTVRLNENKRLYKVPGGCLLSQVTHVIDKWLCHFAGRNVQKKEY